MLFQPPKFLYGSTGALLLYCLAISVMLVGFGFVTFGLAGLGLAMLARSWVGRLEELEDLMLDFEHRDRPRFDVVQADGERVGSVTQRDLAVWQLRAMRDVRTGLSQLVVMLRWALRELGWVTQLFGVVLALVLLAGIALWPQEVAALLQTLHTLPPQQWAPLLLVVAQVGARVLVGSLLVQADSQPLAVWPAYERSVSQMLAQAMGLPPATPLALRAQLPAE